MTIIDNHIHHGETKPIHAQVAFNFYFDHFDTLLFILD